MFLKGSIPMNPSRAIKGRQQSAVGGNNEKNNNPTTLNQGVLNK